MRTRKKRNNDQPGLVPQKPAPKKINEDQALENRIGELLRQAPELAGVKSTGIADRIVCQIGSALVHPKPKDAKLSLLRALEAIGEMAPQGPVQSMLAAQMIAANEASTRFLAVAFEDGHTLESRTANVNRAVRLMHLFLLQAEAVEKLRGKSVQQKVVVEHVHIHEGGQAIVGAVTQAERGEGVGDGAKNGWNTP